MNETNKIGNSVQIVYKKIIHFGNFFRCKIEISCDYIIDIQFSW